MREKKPSQVKGSLRTPYEDKKEYGEKAQTEERGREGTGRSLF